MKLQKPLAISLYYYVGTPTCHSISYSIPFHLTALLPLSVHQSAQPPSQQRLNHHSLTPSFSVHFQTKETAPGKRNYTQQATPTSSANQPVAEQTVQQATCIKGAHITNERSSFGKSICQQHTEKEAWQDRRHDCLATMPRGSGTAPLRQACC